MRIAVVDDESMFRMQMEMMIKKLSDKKEIPLSIDSFSTGEEFINTLSSIRYDVVFMDIFMPDMDGIAVATKMREMTERTFLIFMTASDGHYPDAFSLHAFDYVTKPFTMERIEQVIDEIIDHTPMDEAFIKVSVSGQDIKIYLRDIVSVTTDGHYIDIHINEKDDVRARMTSSEFFAMSGDDDRFVLVNRGVIVNMDYIETATVDEVTLKDGSGFGMVSKKSAAILQRIHDYKFLH